MLEHAFGRPCGFQQVLRGFRLAQPFAQLRSLQLAFREASEIEDPPGEGPGERLTGPVRPRR